MGVEGSLWQEKEKPFLLTTRHLGPSDISGGSCLQNTAAPPCDCPHAFHLGPDKLLCSIASPPLTPLRGLLMSVVSLEDAELWGAKDTYF